MKTILFCTASRADYGKMKRLMQVVHESDDFDLEIFVTGMHLKRLYGQTIEEIRKDFPINKIHFHHCESGAKERFNQSFTGIMAVMDNLDPDLVVLHGDRIEILACASAASISGRKIVHVEGGEVSGTIDEGFRYATSALSHIHLVANMECRRRLINCGQDPQTIKAIGSPDVDLMLSDDLPDLDSVLIEYEIPTREYGVFIYHPVFYMDDYDILQEAGRICKALIESGKHWVVAYPGDDPGCDSVLKSYEMLRNRPKFRILPSIRFERFLTLLKNCQMIIGNSSAGIREAPVFGKPTLDIGTRQNGRWKSESIVNIMGENVEDVLNGITSLWGREFFPATYWGRGLSGKSFMKELRDGWMFEVPLQKTFYEKGRKENGY